MRSTDDRPTEDRRDAVGLAVRRVVIRDSRLSISPDQLDDAEPLNGDLLRINSLGFLGMIVQLEDDLDVVLPDDLFVGAEFTVVGDLVDVVHRAMGERP
jgi:acyl carrier protein